MGSIAGHRSPTSDAAPGGRLQVRIARPTRSSSTGSSLWGRGRVRRSIAGELGGAGSWRHSWVHLIQRVLLFTLATLVVGGSLIASPWLVGKSLQLGDSVMNVKGGASEYEWLFAKLREGRDRMIPRKESELWGSPASNGWRACLDGNATSDAAATKPSGYYQVFCSGGLNQLHICICNSVVVAKLLGATLVLPALDVSPVWNDPSAFDEIFDLPYFLAELEGHISIATELPQELKWSTWEYYFGAWGGCYMRPNCVMNAPKHATPEWYLENVRPRITKFGVAVSTPSSHRLTFDNLDPEFSRLRCWVAYHALRFAPPLRSFASILTQRLREKAASNPSTKQEPRDNPTQKTITTSRFGALRKLHADSVMPARHQLAGAATEQDVDGSPAHPPLGRYVALHLRYEIDMLAHSKCPYGKGWYEKWSLKSFRMRLWKGHVPNAMRNNGSYPTALWLNGKCPLSPEEIALLLAALGYSNSTTLFVASHRVFGGEERLRVLQELFPRIESKHSLATVEELKPFLATANKLAAIDQLICLDSDVFISNAAGNLPNVVAGLRTFHSRPQRSIHVDKANVTRALSDKSLTWDEFSEKMVAAHADKQGSPTPRKPKYSVYRYPAPDCMCQSSARRKS